MNEKWVHQDKAVDCFLEHEYGVLEMATGTGKTRTAIRIMRELLRRNSIDQVLVVTYGNDLLKQWYRELLVNFEGFMQHILELYTSRGFATNF